MSVMLDALLSIKDVSEENAREAASLIERPCRSPERAEKVMARLNDLLGGYGVEAIAPEGAWVDSYHHNIIATYVNMGDTYNATVVYDTDMGTFSVTSYGDWLEEWERDNATG